MCRQIIQPATERQDKIRLTQCLTRMGLPEPARMPQTKRMIFRQNTSPVWRGYDRHLPTLTHLPDGLPSIRTPAATARNDNRPRAFHQSPDNGVDRGLRRFRQKGFGKGFQGRADILIPEVFRHTQQDRPRPSR